jgi:nucleoside-diphosphate-sugar epimerase
MKVFVAGGTGFFGKRLVARLAAEGHAVSYGSRRGDNGTSGHWRADVVDPAALVALLSRLKPDWVINCAAYGVLHSQRDTQRAFTVNVAGAAALVDAAHRAGASRFLHIGTCFEYGDHDGPIAETATLRPTGIHGVTKAAGGLLVAERAARLGLPFMIARLFSLWGENDEPNRLFATVIRSCVTRQALPLTDGEQRRDYIHADDAAEAVASLLAHERFGTDAVVNIGYGKGESLREIAVALAQICGDGEMLRFGELPYRSDEMMSLVADVRRLATYGITLPDDPARFAARVKRIAEKLAHAGELQSMLS